MASSTLPATDPTHRADPADFTIAQHNRNRVERRAI